MASIAAVQPVHVATWIEAGTGELAAQATPGRNPSSFRLAGDRPGRAGLNPAGSVRGPRHVVTVTSPLMIDCLSKRGAPRGDHTACRNKVRLILVELCDLLRNSFGKLQVVVTGRSQLVGNDGQ
jgi:hypothetical protein